MKSSTPKGVLIFSIITLVSVIFSARSLFNPEASIIVFGLILSGWAFKIYQSTLLIINCAIAINLIFLKKWAFQSYFALFAFYILGLAINYMLVDIATLANLGWQITENSLNTYRSITIIGVVITCCFAFWLFCYRKHFFHRDKVAC